MYDIEQRIRAAAQEFYDAVRAGEDVGLRIDWPGAVAGLPSMGISQVGPPIERVALIANADATITELTVDPAPRKNSGKPVRADV